MLLLALVSDIITTRLTSVCGNVATLGLIVGADPVQVNGVGSKTVEPQGKSYLKGESPMRPPVRHVRAAKEKYGIGICNPAATEIARLRWK